MKTSAKDPVLDWLLEKEDPSVRYFTLRHLLDRPETEADVVAARRALMRRDPVKSILEAQQPDGYWVKPGSGYSPKYQSTVWQILFLAEFGADGRSGKVRRGCEYLIGHAQASHGGFSATAGATASGAIHCLDGNLIWALLTLGYGHDERVRLAVEWLAGSISGDGYDRWYASGVTGPGFRCAANEAKPCAWGAVKALRALNALPTEWRTPRTEKSRAMAVEFLLGRDLAKADYPYTVRVSGEWFKFGFPLSYTSDVLEALMALSEAGAATELRLHNALDLVESKRGADGRWHLKHSLNGKMWADVEIKGKPSKWVTLRAMKVLKAAGRD